MPLVGMIAAPIKQATHVAYALTFDHGNMNVIAIKVSDDKNCKMYGALDIKAILCIGATTLKTFCEVRLSLLHSFLLL